MAEGLLIIGGCYCGKVRYQITQTPVATGICHCESCRRIAGAESVGWAVNKAEAFAFSKGQPQVFRSSPGVVRTFCGECGTCLSYRRDDSQFVDIALATLDDPELLPPGKETWCEDRVSWNALNDKLAHYQRGTK